MHDVRMFALETYIRGKQQGRYLMCAQHIAIPSDCIAGWR
jgi:hypothetical protein